MVLTPYDIRTEEEEAAAEEENEQGMLEKRLSHGCGGGTHAKSCESCSKVYGFFTRRHHCRVCAKSICFKCSNTKEAYRRCFACAEGKTKMNGVVLDRERPALSSSRSLAFKFENLQYPLSVETVVDHATAIFIGENKHRTVSIVVITTKALYILNHRTLNRIRRVPLREVKRIVMSENDPSFGISVRKQKPLLLSTIESTRLVDSIKRQSTVGDYRAYRRSSTEIIRALHASHLRKFLYMVEAPVPPPALQTGKTPIRSSGASAYRHIRSRTV